VRLPVAAIVAAVWSAVTSFAPVAILVGFVTLDTPGVDRAAVGRLALAAWLLGHRVPVGTATDQVTLVPLALSALVCWRLGRAGVHASRSVGASRSGRLELVAAVALAVGVVHAGLGVLAARLAGHGAMSIPVGRAGVTCGLVATVAAGVGAAGHSRAFRSWLDARPTWLVAGARTGLVTAMFMVALGAAVAGAGLAAHGGEAAEMLGAYRAGVIGQAGITLVCLGYAPNLAGWGTSYLLGPGFAVGTHTVVSPAVVMLGPLPAVPALAAVPDRPMPGPAAVLLGAPLAAAMLAGWLLVRGTGSGPVPEDRPGWAWMARGSTIAGLTTGVLIGLFGMVAGGGLGSGRLAVLGPPPWRVGLNAVLVATAGILIGAVAARAMANRRRPPPSWWSRTAG
jgi:uncharacterized protein DUF6350